LSGGNITLRNFDPWLLSPIPVIKKMVNEMIDELERQIHCKPWTWYFAKYSCGSR
jgi:hypothetical protein